ELLSRDEALRALQLPVRQANVFGENPITSEAGKEQEILQFFSPSRGLTPTFGSRVSEYLDGDHFLYLLIAKGNIPALLDRPEEQFSSKILVKVGLSNNPVRRCQDFNSSIPPNSSFTWYLEQ